MDYLSNFETFDSNNATISASQWSAHSSVDTATPNETESDSLLLINQLQTTLDVSELLSIFFNHIGSSYKVHSIKFSAGATTFQHGNARANEISQTMPLNLGNEVIGQLTYYSVTGLSSLVLRGLSSIQRKLFYPIKNAMTYYQLQQQSKKDSLTGADNRVSYDENIQRAIYSARRHNRPFVLMLLDLDNFKQVNDRHGHQSGDQVLKAFTELVQNSLRGTDQLFRFGGDEFAVILDQDKASEAEAVAHRLSNSLSESLLSRHFKVGVSIGYTQFNDSDNAERIFARADQALYAAKGAGKNCFKFA